MILAECAVFAAMFGAGAIAQCFAALLYLLGGGSKAARAVTDLLMAAAYGAAYFFTLYFCASGEFRLYSLAAFLLGIGVTMVLLRKAAPAMRRFARAIVRPLRAAYDKCTAKWQALLAPVREKGRLRREKRSARRIERKRKLQAEKQKRLRKKRKPTCKKKAICK